MPDLRAVMFVLRHPELRDILALHAAAAVAAACAPFWIRPSGIWGARVVLLGFALPMTVLLRLLAFHVAAPRGITSALAATVEFCATVFPYTWLGPMIGAAAFVRRSGRISRSAPHLMAAAAVLGLLWTGMVLAQAARMWPIRMGLPAGHAVADRRAGACADACVSTDGCASPFVSCVCPQNRGS